MKSELTRFFQIVSVKDLTHAELRLAVKRLNDDDTWNYFDSLTEVKMLRESTLSPGAVKFAVQALEQAGIKSVVVDQDKRTRWFTELADFRVGKGFEYRVGRKETMWVVFFGKFHQIYTFDGKNYKVYTSDNIDSYMMISPIKEGTKRIKGNDGEWIEVDRRDKFAAYEMHFVRKGTQGAMAFGRTPQIAFENGYGCMLA